MQLKLLSVFDGEKEIRRIEFKDGINIITNSGAKGNQVGKSSALRAINFCLGGSHDSFWVDPDNGKINEKIKKFLTKGTVRFELTLKLASGLNKLSRSLFVQAQRNRDVIKTKNFINSAPFHGSKKYKNQVAKLFGYHRSQPNYGAIKNKFFRINRQTCNSSTKYLTAYTSDNEYSLIYSYLYGFDGINNIQELNLIDDEIVSEKERIKALLGSRKIEDLKSTLKEVDSKISDLESREDDYDIIESQNHAISKLKKSRQDVAIISTKIANLQTKLFYNQKTIERYKNNIFEADINSISKLYNEARSLIQNPTKTLEQTIEFHNSIMLRKAQYVEELSNGVKNEIHALETELENKLDTEKKAVKEISRDSQFSGFILIEKEIQNMREERGRINFTIDEVRNSEKTIKEKEHKKEEIRKEIILRKTDFDSKLAEFNKSYRFITKKIFGSHYNELLANNDDSGKLRLTIKNEELNTGDGAPRAAAMAFDMAYVDFGNRRNSRFISFSVQDYLESADEDKLKTLFMIANSRKIQTVVSILSDKLHHLSSSFLKENVVLTLSTDEKFFKIK